MSVVLNPNCDVVYVGYHSGNVRSFDALTGEYILFIFCVHSVTRKDILKKIIYIFVPRSCIIMIGQDMIMPPLV